MGRNSKDASSAKSVEKIEVETTRKKRGGWGKGCVVVFLILALILVLFSCAIAPIIFITTATISSGTGSSSVVQEGTDGTIALIRIDGIITSSQEESFWGSAMGATDSVITSRIQRAVDDPTIDGILLQIESPGGEAVASDIISRKVFEARKLKPVVAYSGTIAASGGYMIASASEEFVVHPGVITGSIGVIMQTSNLEGLYEKLGIDTVTIKSDEFKDSQDLFDNPQGELHGIYQVIVDEAYERFVDVIVEGREMDRQKVIELGDGRVYTGRQAVENGLADQEGYFEDAVDVTERLAGIEDSTIIDFTPRPLFPSLFGSSPLGKVLQSGRTPARVVGVYYLPDLDR